MPDSHSVATHISYHTLRLFRTVALVFNFICKMIYMPANEKIRVKDENKVSVRERVDIE